jgi:glutamate---cysteine ligase / carboxylate-amine ligase
MTVGVEEEFFVVDADTGELALTADPLLDAARPRLGSEAVCPELNRCQIEIQTRVCETLAEVEHDLRHLRTQLSALGAPIGLDIVASGTHPFSSWADQEVNRDKEHYAELEDRFQIVARQQVICGCHVHVGIDDPELAIATMDRVRPWLPPLLALSANSPFWNSRDTGFASYRTELWTRWPTAGFAPVLETRARYDDLVDELAAVGAIDEPASLYWYVRPSARYPTIEFRICDVLLHVEDAVALSGLIRALAWTARRDALEGSPVPTLSTEALEAAIWRAARYGLGGALVHPRERRLAPADEVVDVLLEHARDGLVAHDDLAPVTAGVRHIVRRGTGGAVQRETLARQGSLDDVLELVRTHAVPSATARL